MAKGKLAGAVCLTALAGLAAAFAPFAPPKADEGLCVPPPDTMQSWKVVQAPGISVRIPPGFDQSYRSDQRAVYGSGQRYIGFGLGDGPDEIATGGQLDLIDACSTDIGGRPVTIKVLHITLYDKMFTPTGNAGPRYVAHARWPATGKQPTVMAYIISRDRLDLRRLKGVFYTADVGVIVPPKCMPLVPLPAADSIVDSAAIAMRLGVRPSAWPLGTMEVVLRFDSAGVLASMGVTGGNLPDSTKRAIALVVGTNARERPTWAAKLKVTSGGGGFGYEVLEAITCPN
jgi:hypothetical protein